MKIKEGNSGIYKITELRTGRAYIGSSRHLDYRKRNHFNLLKKGQHKNPYLQAYFSEHGSSFVWDIIEYLPPDEELLRDREEYWIGIFRSNEKGYGFNLREVCYNNSGIPGTGKIIKGTDNHKAVPYHLIDLNTGEEYHGKCVAEFCRQQGIKDASGYFVLIRGDINIWQKRFTTPEKIENLTKFKFINISTGQIISSYFLKKMCLENDLLSDQMTKVHCGSRQQHRGWAKFED